MHRRPDVLAELVVPLIPQRRRQPLVDGAVAVVAVVVAQPPLAVAKAPHRVAQVVAAVRVLRPRSQPVVVAASRASGIAGFPSRTARR